MNKINTGLLDPLVVFNKALMLIKDDTLFDFAVFCLRKAPAGFYLKPASGSGKYHPAFAQGEGGLARHTNMTVEILMSLVDNKVVTDNWEANDKGKDLMIVALLLHDVMKFGVSGEAKYATECHAEDAAVWIALLHDQYMVARKPLASLLSTDDVSVIMQLVQTHMGQWGNTCPFHTGEVDPAVGVMRKLVHLADFISSQQYCTSTLDASK